MRFEAPKFDEARNPNVPQPAAKRVELRVLLGYFLAFLLAVWLLVEAVVWALPHLISLPRERAWFAFVGREFSAKGMRLDADMQDMADALAAEMGMGAGFVNVYISEEDEPNAFATFGGNVVLHRGLLNRLPNEESVAAVLAHEIGHIRERDPLRGMSRGLLYGIVAAAFGSETQMQTLVQLDGLRYSREMEYRADSLALNAVARRYGSTDGVFVLFATLTELESEQGSGLRLSWLSTHPDTEARIRALQKQAAEKGYQQTPAALPNRWRKP